MRREEGIERRDTYMTFSYWGRGVIPAYKMHWGFYYNIEGEEEVPVAKMVNPCCDVTNLCDWGSESKE